MKECTNCNKEFPTKVWIEGKKRNIQNRKLCFDCSPFGTHNTRKVLQVTNKCKHCGKDSGKRRKQCSTCVVTRFRQRNKLKAVEYKGGSCNRCGYNKTVKALQFHHRDRTTKTNNPSLMWSLSWETIRIELDKCDLVCANCHAEIEEEVYCALS